MSVEELSPTFDGLRGISLNSRVFKVSFKLFELFDCGSQDLFNCPYSLGTEQSSTSTNIIESARLTAYFCTKNNEMKNILNIVSFSYTLTAGIYTIP